MKKMIALLGALVLSVLLIIIIVYRYPKEIGFMDFPQYEKFTEEIIGVDVYWDNNTEHLIIFTVTDESTVNSIVKSLVNEARFLRAGSSMNDGGHGYIVLTDSNNTETTVSLFQIQYGTRKQYYNYANADFYNLIRQIGQDTGEL